MNEYLQNKLNEVVATNNIAFMLNNNNDFSVTGYKVMQNQTGAGLLPCAKLMYNGKVKLVYMVGNYKPLSFAVTRFGVNELNAIIFNLVQKAIEIQGNGFFRAENLELDFDKIFVDMSDYSVHLIYFPIVTGNTGKISNFDSEFRIALINLFNSFPVFTAPQFQRLCSDLSNGSMTIGLIFKRLQDNINGNYGAGVNNGYSANQNDYGGQQFYPNQRQNGFAQQDYINQQQFGQQAFNGGGEYVNQGFQQPLPAPQPTLLFQAIGSPVPVNLSITEPEYLIGKNPSIVNGAVTHNPAISRVHCKISYTNGKYYLTDMGSANGTFLNQSRLNKQETRELHNGDYVRLANSDFIVSF